MKHTLLACLCALAIQPVLFACWSALPALLAGESVPGVDILKLSAFVLLVATAHLLILGLPGFWALNKVGKATTLNVALLGFIVGSIGIAAFAWPATTGGSSFSATWHGKYTELIVGGKPTIAGWLNYLEGVAQFGAHGLLGGMVFLHVWRRAHAA
ncbi:hypothetical protein KAK07_25025 [Ideonella sp. 4Y16]|uniref:DUF4149 domain-containing protein n=1 Tax=Ideonella alba TaxID=2824118 RepID=A0A940YHU6_9BURK|nr:hypothetical protein [Ideonella alba]MBQ0933671.1 hypothetical protein [Ideonella alba]MBQ0946613.1 hypothetical protein [Ideonella alba]